MHHRSSREAYYSSAAYSRSLKTWHGAHWESDQCLALSEARNDRSPHVPIYRALDIHVAAVHHHALKPKLLGVKAIGNRVHEPLVFLDMTSALLPVKLVVELRVFQELLNLCPTMTGQAYHAIDHELGFAAVGPFVPEDVGVL